jgi:thiamine biosynthesis lipoprotein
MSGAGRLSSGGRQKKDKRYWLGLAFVFLWAAAFAGGLASCAAAGEAKALSFSSTRFLMDTLVTIRLEAAPGAPGLAGKNGLDGENSLDDQPLSPLTQKDLERLVEAAFSRMAEIAAKTDRHDPEGRSDLQRLQEAAGSGQWLAVSRDTLAIQEGTNRLNGEAAGLLPGAGGLIDTSLAGLIDLWAGARGAKTLPAEEEIRAALAASGMEHIEMDLAGGKMRLALAGLGLDYGAVAKGYAVAEAGRILAQGGPAVYGIIDAGGNIMTIGQKPDGSLWQVGLTDPLNPRELLAVIQLETGQVAATSGDYQRYEDIGGRRYHHILSPEDGWPVWYNHSVTAVAEDGLKADYYSTLLFLLPPAEALALAESVPDLEAVWLTAEKEAYATSGLRERIRWQDKAGYTVIP